MPRFILEGEWSGYHAGQRKIVHREIITPTRAKNFKCHCVVYTDNTTLILHVREAKPREKVTEIKGYTSLIRKAEATGKSHVSVAHDLKDDVA